MTAAPLLFRAPMRARTREDPPGHGAQRGLGDGTVGIGEPLHPPPGDLAAAVAALAAAHGAKAGRLLDAFAAAPDGSLVWTRDLSGSFHLGRLAGPWRYDHAAARATGIAHVRPAAWLDRPFAEEEVPGAVAATFARGGRNFQRIRDEAAARASDALWQRGSR